MTYTQFQVKAAKDNAKLHGYTQDVPDDVAIAFVDWYLANTPKCNSVEDENAVLAFKPSDKCPNWYQSDESPIGIKQQKIWWESRLNNVKTMLKENFQELALDIIGSSDRPLMASEIIQKTGIPKTSGLRYLKQMVEAKMLTRQDDRWYAIAPIEKPLPVETNQSLASRKRIGESLDICFNALSHLKPVRDLSIKGYLVDLYFPDQRLAVEAAPLITDDPMDQMLDLQRSQFLTRILGCQWILFNPYQDDFCPGKVINQVIRVVQSAIACEVV